MGSVLRILFLLPPLHFASSEALIPIANIIGTLGFVWVAAASDPVRPQIPHRASILPVPRPPDQFGQFAVYLVKIECLRVELATPSEHVFVVFMLGIGQGSR